MRSLNTAKKSISGSPQLEKGPPQQQRPSCHCCCCCFSHVRLLVTPWTAAHQAPPSLGFSKQEHWSVLPFPSPMHETEKWKCRRSVLSNSEWPHELQPTRLLHPWDFPGKSTGVGCHCLRMQKYQWFPDCIRVYLSKTINTHGTDVISLPCVYIILPCVSRQYIICINLHALGRNIKNLYLIWLMTDFSCFIILLKEYVT